ncbi:hypothetical protein [Methanococcoides methylutens]|uniref:Lipoprotein n=1 Tax=Methanococcoides methylutens MM1 TaxID=1434104 RepID=A0A0E3SS21_METMT|nr:hypothetical protein [Methanococcoides methylutens]AKB85228.1 hypothetical protein MCMEM_1175 [Methanococcoides methylutens MM1]
MKKATYLALIALFILSLFVSGCVDQKTMDHQEKNIVPWNNLKDSPLKFLAYNDKFEFHPENSSLPPKDEMPPLRKDPEKFIEDMITRSETTALQIESGINKLETRGKDVKKLRSLFEDYEQAIERARENQKLAYETKPVTQINKRYYLTQSLQDLDEANGILKEIFEELKIINPGSVDLELTDTISANGNGTAVLTGDLTINLYSENGIVAISNLNDDIKLDINADHEISSILHEGQNVSLYKRFNGSADIMGSGLKVMIKGNNISFTSSGQGFVMMSGNGTYNVSTMDGQTEQGQWMTTLDRI